MQLKDDIQMGINLHVLYCCVYFALQQFNNSNNSVCMSEEANASLLCNTIGSGLSLLFHLRLKSLSFLEGKNVLMSRAHRSHSHTHPGLEENNGVDMLNSDI